MTAFDSTLGICFLSRNLRCLWLFIISSSSSLL